MTNNINENTPTPELLSLINTVVNKQTIPQVIIEVERNEKENENQDRSTDFISWVKTLKFQPAIKKKSNYRFVASTEKMPSLSYAVYTENKIDNDDETDSKENKQKEPEKNDVVVCGPNNEKSIYKKKDFIQKFSGNFGQTMVPEQSEILVAKNNKPRSYTFNTPSGQKVTANNGDYIHKVGENKFYRISKDQFDSHYTLKRIA